MEFKGTNEKWTFRKNSVNDGYYIETLDKSHKNTFIGDVGGGLQPKEEIKANAKLMSKAPELLQIAINTLHNFNGLRVQNRLNDNGIKEHENIKEIINYIFDNK